MEKQIIPLEEQQNVIDALSEVTKALENQPYSSTPENCDILFKAYEILKRISDIKEKEEQQKKEEEAKYQTICTQVYPQGGIDCNEEHCLFRSECANHRTAGEFRSEDGFSPELIVKNKDGQYSFKCLTKTRNVNEDSREPRCLPENYNKLGRGSLFVDKKNNTLLNTYDYMEQIEGG